MITVKQSQDTSSTSLPTEHVVWPWRRGGIVREDGISRQGEKAQGTLWVEQMARKPLRLILNDISMEDFFFLICQWLELYDDWEFPFALDQLKCTKMKLVEWSGGREGVLKPAQQQVYSGLIRGQVLSIWYQRRGKLCWCMNLIKNTLKLFLFFLIWLFTNFTDNFISKKRFLWVDLYLFLVWWPKVMILVPLLRVSTSWPTGYSFPFQPFLKLIQGEIVLFSTALFNRNLMQATSVFLKFLVATLKNLLKAQLILTMYPV